MIKESRILSLINFTIINNLYIPLFTQKDIIFKVWDDGDYIEINSDNVSVKYRHDVYSEEKNKFLIEMKQNELDNTLNYNDFLWKKFLKYRGEDKLKWWKNALRVIYESDYSGDKKYEIEKYILHNIKVQEYSSSFSVSHLSQKLYGHDKYSHAQYLRLLKMVTLPMILIVLSKREEIPQKTDKNSRGLKNKLIVDDLYSKYKLFNSNLFNVKRNSVESYISIFYNQDYKIEKHEKFKNAFYTFNTLEENEIEDIYQYILTSDPYVL